jgi:hypothetical protein
MMRPTWLFILLLGLSADGSKCLQNRRRALMLPGRGGSVRTRSSFPTEGSVSSTRIGVIADDTTYSVSKELFGHDPATVC